MTKSMWEVTLRLAVDNERYAPPSYWCWDVLLDSADVVECMDTRLIDHVPDAASRDEWRTMALDLGEDLDMAFPDGCACEAKDLEKGTCTLCRLRALTERDTEAEPELVEVECPVCGIKDGITVRHGDERPTKLQHHNYRKGVPQVIHVFARATDPDLVEHEADTADEANEV